MNPFVSLHRCRHAAAKAHENGSDPAAADRFPLSDCIIPHTYPRKGEAFEKSLLDKTFAAGILGTGAGIEPEDGTVLEPLDSMVTTVADTRHAVDVTSPEGVEVLIHVAADTADMNGKGFTAHVEERQEVHKGDQVLTFARNRIAAAGYPDIVVVMVTNSDNFSSISGRVSYGSY